MANLNFQQPPRSIASASLSSRSSGGFGGSSLSGHVTPTSGMFPQSNTNYAPSQQPQLSPSRSVQLSGNSGGPPQISNSGRTSIFGHRAFADRRPMQGLGSMVRIKCALLHIAISIVYFRFFICHRAVIDGLVYAVKRLRRTKR